MVFEHRSIFRIARAIRASGLGRVGSRVQMLKRAGRRIARKGRAIGIRAQRLGRGEADGIRVENIVWIFGAGRTGSSWLSRMMGELEGHTVWFEPWVGALFDPYHLRLENRKGEHFILSPRHRSTWLRSIRAFVLDGARARFPEVAGLSNYLVIKEPGGSVGAPLLMEALPESRMILLVRDPRDVVASWIDAHKEGGWQAERRMKRRKKEKPTAPTVDGRAKRYLQNVKEAKKAYDAHEGRKVLVRYEDLRYNTFGELEKIYSSLDIPIKKQQLRYVAEKHVWKNIPDDQKGVGKSYRKATPGGWKEDLTPKQIEIVERITAPILEEFYGNREHESRLLPSK